MVPFVYLASVCRYLQCLISTLTQASGGGLLFRFPVQSCGEGVALQTDGLCVGRTRGFRPHWVCPCSRVCALPFYTAQAPGCSIWRGPCFACGSSFRVFHKSTDSVGPVFCAFPGRAAQAARSLTGALSPGAVRLLPSLPQFLCALVGCTLCLFWGAGL